MVDFVAKVFSKPKSSKRSLLKTATELTLEKSASLEKSLMSKQEDAGTKSKGYKRRYESTGQINTYMLINIVGLKTFK